MGEPSRNSNTHGMENWTKEEKYHLLQALKAYDYKDLKNLSSFITTKSPEEIQEAITYYKNKISEHPTLRKKAKKITKRNGTNIIPLVDWAKLLTDSLNFKDLHTETSTAIRLIADFEDFPAPVCTNNVDFSKIYHALANALEGRSLCKDKMVISMVDKCLVDTALTSKAFIRLSTFKNAIKTLNLSNKEVNSFPHYTENPELANIRHLASQRSYNPLNLSENVLRPS